jgi:PKD repeat protein
MKLFRNASLLFAASILAAALGCTSSPTEPSSAPATPKPPVPVTTFNVVVTANPPTIISGGSGSSTVTVEVHRTDTGAPPPDGSQVQVTTTLGAFNSAGGPQSLMLQLVNGRASAALFAGADVGTAAVSATFSGATGAANVMIGSPATFFISSVSPNIGDAAGGQTVTILGGGFAQPVRVTFGGAAATVKSVNASQIVVVTPSAAAAGAPVIVGQTASVAVMVTNHVNQVNQQQDSIDKGFTYSVGGGGGGQPSVFSVSPASGTNEGGTRVTITGTGFVAPVQVLFGTGTSAASFNGVEATVVSVSPTQIVAVTPAAHGFGQNLTNQLVDILVKEVNTGFSGVGSQQFKYGSKVLITSMSSGSGSYLGGSKVTIFGSGFEGPVAVSFSFANPAVSVAQAVVSVSGTEIQILTTPAPLPPTCPKNGLISSSGVSVVNINTGDSGTAPIGFNFQLPTPDISGFTPSSALAGQTLTIKGQSFSPQSSSVTFGNSTSGNSAQILSASSSAISVVVPPAPTGFTFSTVPCGNGGTKNVATPIAVTVTDNSTGCMSASDNTFELIPADTTTCTGQAQQTPPTASFTATPIDGHTFQFVDTSTATAATITSWMWDFGDGSPITAANSQQNPTHTYTGPFPRNVSVKLRVTDSNNLTSNQAVQVITVPGP